VITRLRRWACGRGWRRCPCGSGACGRACSCLLQIGVVNRPTAAIVARTGSFAAILAWSALGGRAASAGIGTQQSTSNGLKSALTTETSTWLSPGQWYESHVSSERRKEVVTPWQHHIAFAFCSGHRSNASRPRSKEHAVPTKRNGHEHSPNGHPVDTHQGRNPEVDGPEGPDLRRRVPPRVELGRRRVRGRAVDHPLVSANAGWSGPDPSWV